MNVRRKSALVFGCGALFFILPLVLTPIAGPGGVSGPKIIGIVWFIAPPILLSALYGYLFGRAILSQSNRSRAGWLGVLTACLAVWTYILIVQVSSIDPCLFTNSCREYSWARFWNATIGICVILSIPVGVVGLICGRVLYRDNQRMDETR